MKIIGHRGARGLAPENTLRAFEKALEYGVDEIELDVHVTRDGQIVLVHDPFVTDASGGRMTVADHQLAELRRHKPDLITFEEALAFINQRAPIYIDVKPGVPAAKIVRAVRRAFTKGWKGSDFRLGSHDQVILRELHAALPGIQKVVIENWSALRAVRRAQEINTGCICMLDSWLWPGVVRSMARAGYQLYSFPPGDRRLWRILKRLHIGGASNNPRAVRHWTRQGLAGIVTDYPNRFVRVQQTQQAPTTEHETTQPAALTNDSTL